jgi:CxxC motif-containing protein
MDITCIVCPIGCHITVTEKGGEWEASGHACSRGRDFAIREATNPTRSLTSTVRTADPRQPRLPVKTDGEVPLRLIPEVMAQINKITLRAPVRMGEVILPNVSGTGVNIVSTFPMEICKEV